MDICRLSEWNTEEMVRLWNRSFSDYYSNMTLDVAAFNARLSREGLSPDHSLIAGVKGEPVGFVLNGIREVRGRREAWNGGTAVLPEFRGQGVGRRLMEETILLYRGEGVQRATLEAISVNERAISLYRSHGYRVVDVIRVFQTDSFRMSGHPDGGERVLIRKGQPEAAGRLPFYRHDAPWQSHWMSAVEGEALIVEAENGESIGYALVRRNRNESGVCTRISVTDLGVRPDRPDRVDIARTLLKEAFSDHPEVPGVVLHVSDKASWLSGLLEESGFKVMAEQVYMEWHP
ncbi:GNAT family N-acetyltransferase [Staphylospora marina]|uniref:GNAT family N-acetyltransferase n=1 Tax=Staphylospora marina TaxID=2490858 RepID=UPI0013DE1CB4|nr:GNAT family N-acetyltransferase [Staphylospora marina]